MPRAGETKDARLKRRELYDIFAEKIRTQFPGFIHESSKKPYGSRTFLIHCIVKSGVAANYNDIEPRAIADGFNETWLNIVSVHCGILTKLGKPPFAESKPVDIDKEAPMVKQEVVNAEEKPKCWGNW